MRDLNDIRLEGLHFAWDDPQQDLSEYFRRFSEQFAGNMRSQVQVYMLTNYEKCSVEEHIERALYRIYKLREINDGYNPYLMIYDKPSADKRLLHLQRWCNSKFIYRACPRFEDYRPGKQM